MPRTVLTAASSAGTAALLLFAVSACGGGDTPDATTPAPGAQQQNQSAGPGSGPGQGVPGASGKVAAISGKTLQVQSAQTGQVAVTYTAKTRFTEAVQAAASAVKVGSCVMVRSTDTGAATAAATAPVEAASVQVTEPVKGECGGRGASGGGDGGGFGGAGGARPSGAPTDASGPGRGAGGGSSGARPVSGSVTAVHGSTISVAAVTFGGERGPGAAGSTASPAATPSTTSVEVTTSAKTTYTKTVTAAAKDLAVGQCVTAIGSANDTGAVTATVIASQPAVDGECAAGLGARRLGAGGAS